jgi:hypothetical protein
MDRCRMTDEIIQEKVPQCKPKECRDQGRPMAKVVRISLIAFTGKLRRESITESICLKKQGTASCINNFTCMPFKISNSRVLQVETSGESASCPIT